MSANSNFIRTDLAKEAKEAVNIDSKRGISYIERQEQGIHIADMRVKTKEGSMIIGKPIGRYITLECGKTWLMSDQKKEAARNLIAKYTLALAPKNPTCLICVGLGNRDITPDALGPLVADSLLVTRHIKSHDHRLFESLGQREVAAITPGVVGQTGIETLELIRGAVERVRPDCVVAIDALAARSVDRLATTVQLSDTGIAPGSGIGNRRKEISYATLGVPCISVGVPTVVDSSTLVYDALSKAGIEQVDAKLTRVLENGKSFFVSLKESDIAIAEAARLIAESLNLAFCRQQENIL